RRHDVPKDDRTWQAIVDLERSIRSMHCDIHIAPSETDRKAMRDRLLEDPSGPWIAEGLRECAKRGMIDEALAEKLARDVGATTFAHGDLLLRNIVRHGDALAIVDWECAGMHAEGWDAALLSVFAPADVRRELSRDLDPRSLRACFVFALLREIAFRRSKR